MNERRILLAVAVGGALGAAARYGADHLVADGVFPATTLVVNVVGAVALGMVLVSRRVPAGDLGRALLGIGFCGGFTTFSTLALQAAQRSDSHPDATLLYLALSLALAGPSVALGQALARRVDRAPGPDADPA